MRDLHSNKQVWNYWAPTQEEAFTKVKAELMTNTVLVLYDSQTDTKISVVSFFHSLGAARLQKHNKQWQSVVYVYQANIRDRS